MKKWFVLSKKADFYEIGKKFGIDPVIARIIRNRDICSESAINEFLNGNLDDLHNPALMKGIEQAVFIIRQKIVEKKPIRIIGDYDIDGICSTYILLKALKKCGARVDYDIPDRVKDGYGINISLINKANEDGIDTIVTCDNGIAATKQIEFAKELNMTVIITDHHEIPFIENEDMSRQEIIPDADVVVNPKQKTCLYPFKEICGAVVAFKLAWQLLISYDFTIADIMEYLEFAAIATVGDIVDLTGENRIIVKYGLKKLENTQNIGLMALKGVCNLSDKTITSYHIGFVLGPCINASGRLDTAKLALSLFLEEDYEKANSIAQRLKELNDERKAMTLKGVDKAVEIIEKNKYYNDKVMVIYIPDCHESLLGIIAGRLKEKYYRPVFALSDGEQDIKGSGRSIENYNMFEEMVKCKEFFTKFGGHSMAAGLSLKKENIIPLKDKLNENTSLIDEDLIEKVLIDVPMPLSYITEELINQLELLEPFGKGNNKPVFAVKDIYLIEARVIGKNQNVLKMKIREENKAIMDGIFFDDIELFKNFLEAKYGKFEIEKLFKSYSDKVRISIVYYPQINEYNGVKNVQIVIKDYC